MKKNSKPDIEGMLLQVQQQITFLDKKIDDLIAKSATRPVEAKPFQRPFHRSGHTGSYGGDRQDNNYRERVLHKAVCADCKKECEVPFKPTGERPVYCKECFSKRKTGSAFHTGGNRPKETFVRQRHPAAAAAPLSDKGYYREKNRRFIEKKKSGVKRGRKIHRK